MRRCDATSEPNESGEKKTVHCSLVTPAKEAFAWLAAMTQKEIRNSLKQKT